MENLNQNIRTPFAGQEMNLPLRNENLKPKPELQGQLPEQAPEAEKELIEQLREKYKTSGAKIYEVKTSFNEDDEVEKMYDFIFKRPNTASYDRYVKTSATSGSKALKMFLLDNICPEQERELQEALEEYPAMSIGIGEKLLNMLGLSKETQVKKL